VNFFLHVHTLIRDVSAIYPKRRSILFSNKYFAIILGLDNAGKTTLLERIKVIYNGIKGLTPEQIGPTVGLNGLGI
jgi:ABC-type cobalamin/Fe3+-siderophores transport system ATPase subunit